MTGCSKLRKQNCTDSNECNWFVGKGCKKKPIDSDSSVVKKKVVKKTVEHNFPVVNKNTIVTKPVKKNIKSVKYLILSDKMQYDFLRLKYPDSADEKKC